MAFNVLIFNFLYSDFFAVISSLKRENKSVLKGL